MKPNKRQSAIDRFYNGTMRAKDGPILVDELLRDNGSLRNSVHSLRSDAHSLKSEITQLRAQIKTQALGIIENCKLCRVHGLGRFAPHCDPCPTKKRELEARAIADREGWEI